MYQENHNVSTYQSPGILFPEVQEQILSFSAGVQFIMPLHKALCKPDKPTGSSPDI